MKSKINAIASVILIVILAVAVVVGFILLTQYRKDIDQNDEYSIIVDDSITVYAGDTYTLIPYLITPDGTIEESRFQYASSAEEVKVTEDGVISVTSVPEGKVEITVYERNTHTSAIVEVNVVSQLTNVLGVTISDSQGNKTLISGHQTLSFGERYSIDVITEPKNVNLQDYCSIRYVDENGQSKQVFDVAYNQTNVNLFASGLGDGKIVLDISNNSEVLYSAEISFTISMEDEVLGRQLLESAGTTLLTKEELDAITSVSVPETVTNIAELDGLKGLNTVVFTSDSVMQLSYIPDDLCYRVKTSLFYDYIQSEIWSEYVQNIIPYENSADETFVVYHNFKTLDNTEEITFAKVQRENYALPVFEFTGYINCAWRDNNEQEMSAEQVIRSGNGIHIYAVWRPIEFTIRYNVRGSTTVSEEWNYETYSQLKKVADLSDKTITGYKFIGWTTDENTEYDLVDYQEGIKYGQDDFTTVDGSIINVYDVWTQITYTLRFNIPDDATLSLANDESEVQLKYNELYELPYGLRTGYKFVDWSNGDLHYSAEQTVNALSADDGSVVILTAAWTENSYVLRFDAGGGSAVDNTDFSTYSVTLKYTEFYALKALKRSGYSSYFWYADLNGDALQNEDEPTFNSTANVNRIISEGEVMLRAVWSSNKYIVSYNLNGGQSLEGTNNAEYFYEQSFNIPSAIRTGYTLTGWLFNDKVYSVGEVVQGLATEDGVTVTLVAQWSVNTYTILFDKQGGMSGTDNLSVRYDANLPVAIAPTRSGYSFEGYYDDIYDGKQYYDSSMNGVLNWDKAENSVLYAHWSANDYAVMLDNQGGTGGSSNVTATFGEDMPSADKPSKTGYDFNGYYTGPNGTGTRYYTDSMASANKWSIASDTTLYAYWTASPLTVTASPSSLSSIGDTSNTTITVSGGSGSYNYEVIGSHTGVSCKFNGNVLSVTKSDNGKSGTITVKVTDTITKATATCSIKYSTTCIASGTLITLADGSQVEVEDLKGDEMLLVWNLYTGKFDSAPILFIDSEEYGEYEIILLTFSDGTQVKVISEHAFWDFDLNEYVFLGYDAEKYIGHWFNKLTSAGGELSWTKVQLIDVDFVKEYTIAWSPVTYSHMCYYVNGMLSMPGNTQGLINIFEVEGDLLVYNYESMRADIEKYGLFTYEEFESIMHVSEEFFNAFNGQYLKISLGKGLIDWERIEELIERYDVQ